MIINDDRIFRRVISSCTQFVASFNESFLLLTLRKRIDPVRGYRTSIHGDIEQQYMILVFL